MGPKDTTKFWLVFEKSNGARLSYEVGVALLHSQIVWINGPFPADQNDNQIFQKPGGLKEQMSQCRICGVGDKGYQGHSEMGIHNVFDDELVANFIQWAGARHETINAKLKSFSILSEPFCGRGNDRLDKHKAAFEACAVVVQ